ncbi:MAG TPA: hypothetical protein VK992_03865 [Candidatus Caenarcaniphilales bacterium]|nr:hypothetical protein [Candidatus Caenarcaniphilales bacterium]
MLVPFKDIFKRQVEDLLSTDRNRRHVSLERDLRDEFDRVLGNAIDPGREQREAARRAADVERTRTQQGLGQFVQIDGIPGEWEAVEMFHFDETSNAFTLVDRRTGETAQLSTVDDGTVILDSPGDQHGGNFPGAFWRTEAATGVRLDGAELTADQTRRVRVTCDLHGEVPPEEPEYGD